MRRNCLHLLGVLLSLPLLFASCGNSDNALEEIINGGGSGGHAIKDNVKIKSGTDASKFYFADTEDGLATAVGKAYDGSGTGDMATPAKQYAKAEKVASE